MADADQLLNAIKDLKDNVRSEDGNVLRTGVRDNDTTREAIQAILDLEDYLDLSKTLKHSEQVRETLNAINIFPQDIKTLQNFEYFAMVYSVPTGDPVRGETVSLLQYISSLEQ